MSEEKVTVSNQNLYQMGKLFLLVGEIEINLRKVIPNLLALYFKNPIQDWHKDLPLLGSEYGVLKLALKKHESIFAGRGEQLPSLLPYSFWRNLFKEHHYGDLWLPCLHRVLGEDGRAKEFEVARAFGKSLDQAVRIRNEVSHFNFKIDERTELIENDLKLLASLTTLANARYPQGGIPPEGKSL